MFLVSFHSLNTCMFMSVGAVPAFISCNKVRYKMEKIVNESAHHPAVLQSLFQISNLLTHVVSAQFVLNTDYRDKVSVPF